MTGQTIATNSNLDYLTIDELISQLQDLRYRLPCGQLTNVTYVSLPLGSDQNKLFLHND